MSASEIIEQIKSLPPTERAAVAKFVFEQDDSWIPDDFKGAMKDAEEGHCVGRSDWRMCSRPRISLFTHRGGDVSINLQHEAAIAADQFARSRAWATRAPAVSSL
jgi:hypothetical protein